jgi:hypothetical protein
MREYLAESDLEVMMGKHVPDIYLEILPGLVF